MNTSFVNRRIRCGQWKRKLLLVCVYIVFSNNSGNSVWSESLRLDLSCMSLSVPERASWAVALLNSSTWSPLETFPVYEYAVFTTQYISARERLIDDIWVPCSVADHWRGYWVREILSHLWWARRQSTKRGPLTVLCQKSTPSHKQLDAQLAY